MKCYFSPTSTLHNVPTSLIVYNVTGSTDIDASPVTSLYIYEMSSSELVTRSFLAGEDFIIRTSPGLNSSNLFFMATLRNKLDRFIAK